MGDATLAGFDINGLQQAMLVSRPDGTSTFRLAYAFHTPILAKAHWVPESRTWFGFWGGSVGICFWLLGAVAKKEQLSHNQNPDR